MAFCWRSGSRDPVIGDDIRPIYCYLTRSGWNDSLLLKCTRAERLENVVLNEAVEDPYSVIMRSVDKPTELFKALQTRGWGAALDCLHREQREAKIWIYRETDRPQSQMLWKVLPLHAAIALGAPAYLILKLLQAYPDAAKKHDLQMSLPIHIAAARIDIDADGERILHKLLEIFPESASIENGKGKVPIELAYEAQLRKDKQTKINAWSIDTREDGGGGFELQLEMRDVMESFKADEKNIDPSTWSLGTIPTTSSFSTKSESISYSFLTGDDEKLRIIPESSSKCASPINSSSSESSISSGMKSSIGFQSILVTGEDHSHSTIEPSSFSTASSQSTSSKFFNSPMKSSSTSTKTAPLGSLRLVLARRVQLTLKAAVTKVSQTRLDDLIYHQNHR